jgi:hypothetical protein
MGQEFAIEPGQALGPVVLGMTEEQLTEALGAAGARDPVEPGTLWWGPLRVDLDAAGRTELVELSWDRDGVRPVYRGLDLLRASAEEVAGVLARHEGGYPAAGGYALECPTGLSVWRPVVPEDDDEPGHSPEYRDGRCWATVAVAPPGYWR